MSPLCFKTSYTELFSSKNPLSHPAFVFPNNGGTLHNITVSSISFSMTCSTIIMYFMFYSLGPFLTSVMQLISHIPTNHLYANLQVTQLVIHLLALPLPLIRLQLLPFSMQETADSNGQWFFTTLTTVRQWFDCFINLHSSDFEVASGSRISLANLIDSIRETVFGPPQYSHAEYPISNAAGEFLCYLDLLAQI